MGEKKDEVTGKQVTDYSRIVFNKNVTVTGIPETAQNYLVNGRSPIGWLIDRYKYDDGKKRQQTHIVNDPNAYSDDPCYIVNLIGKLARVSVETCDIVAMLPSIKEIEHPVN